MEINSPGMNDRELFTELRERLFSFEADFTARNMHDQNPIKPYKIAKHIEFDRTKHWIIYDFINDNIWTRQCDRLNAMFDTIQNIYRCPDGTAAPDNITECINSLAAHAGVMLECQLEYKWVLAIFGTDVDEIDGDKIAYLLHQSFMQKKIVHIEDDHWKRACTYKLHRAMNWVWFRKPGAALSPHVIHRARSWLRCNPELEFHLWTNLTDAAEFAEFVREISEEDRQLFASGAINVHYRAESWEIARAFCEKFGVNWEEYKRVLETDGDMHSIVFKTDSFRVVVLTMCGGWYSDFNDTYCFAPLKYLVDNNTDDVVYIGSDNDREYNNYLLYVPRNVVEEHWIRNATSVVNNSVVLAKTLNNRDIMEPLVDAVAEMRRGVSKALLNVEERKKTIIETIYPVILDAWKAIKGLNIPILKVGNKNLIEIYQILLEFVKIISPGGAVFSQLCREGKEVGSIINIERRPRIYKKRAPIIWRKEPDWECDWLALEADGFFDFCGSGSEVGENDYNIILLVIVKSWIQTIMEYTNIGVLYINDGSIKSRLKIIPYCYLYGNYTFLTSIAHIGDGTCTGIKWEGNEETYLL